MIMQLLLLLLLAGGLFVVGYIVGQYIGYGEGMRDVITAWDRADELDDTLYRDVDIEESL